MGYKAHEVGDALEVQFEPDGPVYAARPLSPIEDLRASALGERIADTDEREKQLALFGELIDVLAGCVPDAPREAFEHLSARQFHALGRYLTGLEEAEAAEDPTPAPASTPSPPSPPSTGATRTT